MKSTRWDPAPSIASGLLGLLLVSTQAASAPRDVVQRLSVGTPGAAQAKPAPAALGGGGDAYVAGLGGDPDRLPLDPQAAVAVPPNGDLATAARALRPLPEEPAGPWHTRIVGAGAVLAFVLAAGGLTLTLNALMRDVRRRKRAYRRRVPRAPDDSVTASR